MRCRNADELAVSLHRVFSDAQQVRAVLEQTIRPDADSSREESMFWLECHVRDYVIDHVLAALNWRLFPTGDPVEYAASNLVTEQSPGGTSTSMIEDGKPERSSRMDYLGYERETDRPLLIVEAKRPSFRLPALATHTAEPDAHPLRTDIAKELAALRAGRARSTDSLTQPWQRAIEQIRNYCLEVFQTRAEWPARAVLTNGDWLIVFTDPQNAFTSEDDREVDLHRILIFESRSQIIDFHQLLWRQIEYSALAKVDRPLQVTQIAFAADPECLVACVRGLRVSYAHKPTNFRRTPVLSVSPVLFVRSNDDSFIQLASGWEQELPLDTLAELSDHIADVAAKSDQLKSDLEQLVLNGRVLPSMSVTEHCEHDSYLISRPILQPVKTGDDKHRVFLVLTGDDPHFLRVAPDYRSCAYHCHEDAQRENAAARTAAVHRPTVDPRSFFIDKSVHHCTHAAVHSAKGEPITDANKSRSGHRRAAVGSAFCELWQIEEFLCCRTCSLNSVCLDTGVFSLPCPAPVALTTNGEPTEPPSN